MKKTKIIIPALGLLLLSTAASVTGTVAWFAANGQVTATGMSVTAKTNGAFLQIKPKGGSITADGTTANASTASATVFPAKYNGTDGSDTWRYAYAAATNAATYDGTYRDVAAADVADYRLKNEFTIFAKETVATTSKVYNLHVKSCTVTGTSAFLDAVSLVIVCGTNVQQISAHGQTTATSWNIANPVTLAAEVGEGNSGVDVAIYTYLDGDNSTVYTDNATSANLTGIGVTVVFETQSSAPAQQQQNP